MRIGNTELQPLTKFLLFANIGFFIVTQIQPDLFEYLAAFFPAWKFFIPTQILTHMFMHGGPMHILFNMLWMKDLGKIIEKEKSSNFLLTFIVIIGTLSNFAQFLVSGPNFGGMSGVVYGLLGYLWMYKRMNSAAAFSLPKSDVVLMVGWFFLCLLGVFSFSIANTETKSKCDTPPSKRNSL